MPMIKIHLRSPKVLLAALVVLMASTMSHASNQAEDFVLPSLDGSNKSLSSYSSSVVLLHFWATWCKPCLKELPEIEAAYQSLKDQGFVVVTVNTGDSKQKANAFMKEHGFEIPVLLDKDWKIASQYGVRGLPTSFFIDSNNTIYKKIEGASLTQKEIIDYTQGLLTTEQYALNTPP